MPFWVGWCSFWVLRLLSLFLEGLTFHFLDMLEGRAFARRSDWKKKSLRSVCVVWQWHCCWQQSGASWGVWLMFLFVDSTRGSWKRWVSGFFRAPSLIGWYRVLEFFINDMSYATSAGLFTPPCFPPPRACHTLCKARLRQSALLSACKTCDSISRLFEVVTYGFQLARALVIRGVPPESCSMGIHLF
jgi:hypothetical protein